MGCVSSKKLKKQAKVEACSIPVIPPLYHGQIETFGDCRHHHLVALTSSTYGLLNIDPPNSREEPVNESGVESFAEMYEKLNRLDVDADSVSKSWDEINLMLDVLKPTVSGSDTSTVKSNFRVEHSGSSVGRCQSTDEPETIDIREVMEGLEEFGSSRPSPVKVIHPILLKGPVLKKSRSCKKSVSFLSVEGLDGHVGRLTRANVAPAKRLKDIPVKDCRNYPFTATVHGENLEQNIVDKENMQSSGAALLNLTIYAREGSVALKAGNGNCASSVPPQTNFPKVFQVATKERDSMKKKSSKNEDRVDMDMLISGKSLAGFKSSINGKTNLSLNLGHENAFALQASSKLTFSTPASKTDHAASRCNIVDSPNMYTEPSSPLFDPDLLASYERALKKLSEDDWDVVRFTDEMGTTSGRGCSDGTTRHALQSNSKGDAGDLKSPLAAATVVKLQNKKHNLLLETFEEKCPPGGEEKIVLYTTTLRGIRKTFEDCNNMRKVLQSFSLSIDERDVSMHLDFRSELRELVGLVSVPRLFIKGRYIGGTEEVAQLHENGKLDVLFQGLPTVVIGNICDGCGGVRFVPCLECSGSCKILDEEDKVLRCPDCNENGLIRCPICT